MVCFERVLVLEIPRQMLRLTLSYQERLQLRLRNNIIKGGVKILTLLSQQDELSLYPYHGVNHDFKKKIVKLHFLKGCDISFTQKIGNLKLNYFSSRRLRLHNILFKHNTDPNALYRVLVLH
jgi:hypothetical protein